MSCMADVYTYVYTTYIRKHTYAYAHVRVWQTYIPTLYYIYTKAHICICTRSRMADVYTHIYTTYIRVWQTAWEDKHYELAEKRFYRTCFSRKGQLGYILTVWFICARAHTHAHLHTHTHSHLLVCVCLCMYVCMYVCVYVCIYVCMHACI